MSVCVYIRVFTLLRLCDRARAAPLSLSHCLSFSLSLTHTLSLRVSYRGADFSNTGSNSVRPSARARRRRRRRRRRRKGGAARALA